MLDERVDPISSHPVRHLFGQWRTEPGYRQITVDLDAGRGRQRLPDSFDAWSSIQQCHVQVETDNEGSGHNLDCNRGRAAGSAAAVCPLTAVALGSAL